MAEKLKSKVDKWRTPDGLLLIESWTRDGCTNAMVAKKIGCMESTLWEWRGKFPEIEEAMSRGRELVDYKVENALLKSALGYTVEEVKTIISGSPDKNGNRPVRIEKTVKEIAPNTTAIAIWLNNRKPEQWKRNRDNVLELNDNESKITVNIIKHGENKTAADSDDDGWEQEVSDTGKTNVKGKTKAVGVGSKGGRGQRKPKEETSNSNNKNNSSCVERKNIKASSADVDDEWPDDWEE